MRTGNMRAIAKIGCRIESIKTAVIGVEWILVPEIVVANEKLVLLGNGPVEPDIYPLRMLHGLGSRE